MAAVPEHLAGDELRRQAHELRKAVSNGDATAIERALAAHPKYAGRPAERLRPGWFSLRDAQATVARENGFASWRDLREAVDPAEQSQRWREGHNRQLWARCHEEASQRDQGWCGPDHLVLALLAPPEPTIASQALSELGLTYDDAARRLPRETAGGSASGIRFNPAFIMCRAMAEGLSLATGEQLRDEHALLALAYYDDGRFVSAYSVDPDDIYDALARHDVHVPPQRPWVASTPHGPMGPRVYFPEADWSAVTEALSERYRPGTSHWGWNHSQWRPGECWIDSEDEIDAAEIVRNAAADPALVEVVPLEIASRREAEARQ